MTHSAKLIGESAKSKHKSSNFINKDWDGVVWTGFIWLRMGTTYGLF
jgi:hypothetical protein